MKLGFVVICHESPGPIADLARTLCIDGDPVCIHFDKRASDENYETLRQSLAEVPDALMAPRVPCGWGEYSLVAATLNGLKELRKTGRDLDYVCLLSGADITLKSIAALKAFLEPHRESGTEFIQSNPMNIRKWVVAGMERERFDYRHLFNERRHPRLFNLCWKSQRLLGIRQRVPAELDISLGSQWWCLTWDTCCKILDFIAANLHIDRFFRSTWIPDESYFQTLVRNVVEPRRIAGHSLTHYQFNDYGKPVVYFDEHYDFLRRQNFFFGRKVAPSAKALRDRLHAIGRSGTVEPVDAATIGTYTDEYLSHREIRRPPSAIFRSKGRYYAPPLAEIPYLRQQLVVILHLPQLLDIPAAAPPPAEPGSALIHGDLFSRERIGFAGGMPLFGGFSAADTAARDALPYGFLANVLAAGPDVSAFFLEPSDREERSISEKLVTAPNVSVVAMANASLLEMAMIEVYSRLLRFNLARECSDVDLVDCISEAVLGYQRLRKTVERAAHCGKVWIAGGFRRFDGATIVADPMPEAVQGVLARALAIESAARRATRDVPLRDRVEALIARHAAASHWQAAFEGPAHGTLIETPDAGPGAALAIAMDMLDEPGKRNSGFQTPR